MKYSYFASFGGFCLLAALLVDDYGWLVGLVMGALLLLWYSFHVKKIDRRIDLEHECILFMKYIITGYSYQNKEHEYLSFAYAHLPDDRQKMIVNLSNDQTRLNRLDIFYCFRPFTLLKWTIAENLGKGDRLTALKMVHDFSVYYSGRKNIRNREKSMQNFMLSILESLFLLVIIKYLFPTIEHQRIAQILFLVFIICSVLTYVLCFEKIMNVKREKQTKGNIYLFLIDFLILLQFNTPFSAFENALRFSTEKNKEELRSVMMSFEDHSFEATHEIIKKYDDDIIQDGFFLIYRLSRNNSFRECDKKEVQEQFSRLCSEKEENFGHYSNFLFACFCIVIIAMLYLSVQQYVL